MRNNLYHTYAMLAVVTLLWAGNAVAGKLAAGHVSPMLLTLMRWAAAVAIVAPFAWHDLRREWRSILPRLGFMFCLGAFGFTTFNALFYLSLNYTTALNVTIIQSAMPIVVFIGNWLLFRAGFSLFQAAGFLLTLAGVCLVVSQGQPSTLLALQFNYGDALIVVAVVIYGLYTLLLRFKPLIQWRSTIFILAASALLAAIPFAAVEWKMGLTVWPDTRALLVLLYVAIFPSLLAQSLYIRGVDLIGANRANLFVNLVPVFGAVLAVTLLGEQLHFYHIAALLLVVGGIYLAEFKVRKAAEG